MCRLQLSLQVIPSQEAYMVFMKSTHSCNVVINVVLFHYFMFIITVTYSRLKYQKITLTFKTLYIDNGSLDLNKFGTLPQPNDCLSQSSREII